MIIGVGIDIVKIKRISNLLQKFGPRFENRIFTPNESSIIKNKTTNSESISHYYAKRFAAKEAFSKAIGLGIGRGIDFTDIEILNNDKGKPIIKLSSKAKKFLNNKNMKINLSLTDETDIAQAIVIISQ